VRNLTELTRRGRRNWIWCLEGVSWIEEQKMMMRQKGTLVKFVSENIYTQHHI
jgi:hypothetical protein